MVSRTRGGKAFMTLDDGDEPLAPAPLVATTPAPSPACRKRDGCWCSACDEIKTLASGGRGVILMELETRRKTAGGAADQPERRAGRRHRPRRQGAASRAVGRGAGAAYRQARAQGQAIGGEDLADRAGAGRTGRSGLGAGLAVAGERNRHRQCGAAAGRAVDRQHALQGADALTDADQAERVDLARRPVSMPMPSSLTFMNRAAASRRNSMRAQVARAWRAILVSDSCRIRKTASARCSSSPTSKPLSSPTSSQAMLLRRLKSLICHSTAAYSPRSSTAGRRLLTTLRTDLMVRSSCSSARPTRSFKAGCRLARVCRRSTSMRKASRFCPSSSWISRAMRLRSSSLQMLLVGGQMAQQQLRFEQHFFRQRAVRRFPPAATVGFGSSALRCRKRSSKLLVRPLQFLFARSCVRSGRAPSRSPLRPCRRRRINGVNRYS